MKVDIKKIKLSREEKEQLASIERGEWRSVPNLQKEMARHISYAKAHVRKTKRVNIRLAEMDLRSIQYMAVEEGIPYQTLMASVIHKFVSGRLVPAKA